MVVKFGCFLSLCNLLLLRRRRDNEACPQTIVLCVFEVVPFILLVWIVLPVAEVRTLGTRRFVITWICHNYGFVIVLLDRQIFKFIY